MKSVVSLNTVFVLFCFLSSVICNVAKAEELVATAIAAGKYHTCAIINGKGYCWGYNKYGQLGNGYDCGGSECSNPTPQLLFDSNTGTNTGLVAEYDIIKIAAGDTHSCAIPKEDGDSGHAYCWGENAEGQLGTGDNESSTKALPIVASAYFSDIKLNGDNSCGLYSTGSGISCWGLGNSNPQQVNTLSNVSQLAVGYHHICAINDGKVYCWGDLLSNEYGQLGDKGMHAMDLSTPLGIWDPISSSNAGLVFGNAPVNLWAGGFNTFVKNAEYFYGAGALDMCQLYASSCGTSSALTDVMFTMDSTTNLSEPFSVGFKHSCGIRLGHLVCWGYNNKGQVGNGSINGSAPYYTLSPSNVDDDAFGGAEVTAVSAGFEHTCAIAGGKIYCWGDNTYGQLGDGTQVSKYRPTLIEFDFGDPTEVCGDGIDNDDDSEIDEDCGCNSGTLNYALIGTGCSAGKGVCQVNGKYGCNESAVVCSATEDLSKETTEICDGLDNDCDGDIDESFPEYNNDCDTGEYGVCAAGTLICPAGTLSCYQTTASSTEICDGLDNDCDGETDESFPESGNACSTGLQGVCSAGTKTCEGGSIICHQTTASSTEICDGLDNDCDGQTDESFPEFGDFCSTGLQGVCSAGTKTCEGGAIVCHQWIASSTETCDGFDNDCDGETDESFPESGDFCSTGLQGVCSAGTKTCEGGIVTCHQTTASSTEICDGLDNDCDGQTDESFPESGNACSTGLQGVCSAGTKTCEGGSIVCHQTTASSTEICDGLDNDCDGQTDESFPESGMLCDTGLQGVCSAGTKTCEGGTVVCHQTTASSTEICDGLDNDCDGIFDEDCSGCESDPNYAHIGEDCNTGLVGVCAAGKYACNGSAVICSQVATPSEETCDGLDNDCDGVVDEGCSGCESDPNYAHIGEDCNTGLVGVCAAGKYVCNGSAVECSQTVEALTEVCDGVDNDCDGLVDESFPENGQSCNTGLAGVCAAGIKACSAGAIVCNQDILPSKEVCDGVDNDCDGVVDEDFPEKNEACFIGEGACRSEGVYVCSDDKQKVVCNAKPANPECWYVSPEDLNNDDDKDGITNPYDPDMQNPPKVNNIQKPLKPLVIKAGNVYKLYFQWFADFIQKFDRLLSVTSFGASKNKNLKKNTGTGAKTKTVEDNHVPTNSKADRKLAQCKKTCQRTGCQCKKVRDNKRLTASAQRAGKRGYIIRKTTTQTITNKKIQKLAKQGKVPNEFKVRVKKNCTYKVSYRVVYINNKGRTKNLSPFSEVVEF